MQSWAAMDDMPVQCCGCVPQLVTAKAASCSAGPCCVCCQVTEGPDSGKLALLDFGLVAEIPPSDRAAMVSATIHLVRATEWSGCGMVQYMFYGTVRHTTGQCMRGIR